MILFFDTSALVKLFHREAPILRVSVIGIPLSHRSQQSS
jgi:hypothetical protein